MSVYLGPIVVDCNLSAGLIDLFPDPIPGGDRLLLAYFHVFDEGAASVAVIQHVCTEPQYQGNEQHNRNFRTQLLRDALTVFRTRDPGFQGVGIKQHQANWFAEADYLDFE